MSLLGRITSLAYTGYEQMRTYVSEVLNVISDDAFHALLQDKFLGLGKIVPLAFFPLLHLFIFLNENVFLFIMFKLTLLINGLVSFLVI